MASPGAVQDWTCAGCEMTVSFAPDAQDPKRPSSWAKEDGKLYCLVCRRDRAAEAKLADAPENLSNEERHKLTREARVEFEILRDPERPVNQVAQACHTSIVSVRRTRERMGLTAQTADNGQTPKRD